MWMSRWSAERRWKSGIFRILLKTRFDLTFTNMSLLIGFLTFVLVMNCLFLILLILIQLPKKEAGAGIAFGGAATDALFGAGSGNALTNLTKYSASLFIGMAVLLSVLNMHAAREG